MHGLLPNRANDTAPNQTCVSISLTPWKPAKERNVSNIAPFRVTRFLSTVLVNASTRKSIVLFPATKMTIVLWDKSCVYWYYSPKLRSAGGILSTVGGGGAGQIVLYCRLTALHILRESSLALQHSLSLPNGLSNAAIEAQPVYRHRQT